MDDKLLINALIIMAGIESKQSGAMPLEDNPLFVAANRLKELVELKAPVQELRSACQLGIDMFIANDINVPNSIETMQDALDATPAQCLAEIKAQAVEDAATYLSESIPGQSHESVIFKDRYVYVSTRYMREYANQLRQQAKGGE